MWHRLLHGLIGCARCEERQARIHALERQIADLMDRFMARDYSHFAFVKANTALPREPVMAGDGEEPLGDGLD